MKLREPRIKIPPSTWGKDMLKLMHPMMFAPILMLVVIGTFLAPQLDIISFILELIGVSCAVIVAYHLDEYVEKVTAPNVPRGHHLIIIYIALFFGGVLIGTYFLHQNPILWIPFIIALISLVGYNIDVPYLKNRVVYALVWGGTPIFGSYMLQTGELPNLTVIIFTIFGMLISIKLFWNWSLRTCGRLKYCNKYVSHLGLSDGAHVCHSPGTMRCKDRLQVPKEVNDTMKILQKLDLLILFALMIGVILW